MNDSIDSNFLCGYDSFINDSDDMTMKSELDHYLEEKVLPRDPDFDILAWWKSNGIKYPTLEKIARDILAIPISTMASESVFNTGGRLVSPHRSRLHVETLEALMCAQNWLLKQVQGVHSKVTDAYYRTIEYDSDVEENAKMVSAMWTVRLQASEGI
ncbi:PREDICTED: zinc finger BED domain-containing protein DAYSLEEPER-like [Nelumbo nucifera]|uniref:Zinc finger BED domain-containing protein DAYSLEEPER-like n=1 Tax=Nelumbo nucifera TaxID=4432 RepID=A0A1U8QB95_NELNU|nr:PREDICTED: zinc finger BED domain-containing protein DAYSLEEPER-like [Nelumbo nucifera]